MNPPASTPSHEPSPTRRQQVLSGVRVRSALAAVGVVAAALVIGALVLLFLLQRSLIGSAETVAAGRAQEVAVQVGDEGEGRLAETLQTRGLRGELVQVLDGAGAVVAASGAQAASAPISDLRPPPGVLLTSPAGRLAVLDFDEQYLVAARGVENGQRRYVVLAAVSIESQRESLATVSLYLAGGLPLLLLVVGGATFVFVGRSLRPVEQIRRRVAGIGSRQLDERVPVPPSGDEIARLAETMNSMLERLEGAHNSQRRFVADASHELRSPLATLRAGLDLAGPERDESSWLLLHTTLSAECDRMTRLVDDLLLLAKADEHSVRLTIDEVDLDDIVGAEARRLRTATTLQITADLQPVRIHGDAPRLAQSLRNLADNAARHAQSGIRLSLRVEGEHAVIEVIDDGPGIPHEDRDRVFERFVRLDASRERASGGSGLGLAIVREILAAHQGTVDVSAAPKGGACFSMRIPLQLPDTLEREPSGRG